MIENQEIQKIQETAKVDETKNIQESSTRNAWIGAGIAALVSTILWIVGLKTPAVVLISILFIWTGITYKEIKEPKVGFLFQMGKLKGRLNPGWHLGLPFVWSIEEISTKVQERYLEREEMYTKDQTALALELGIYFRIVDPLKAVYIEEEIAKERVKRVVLSKLKWEIGQLSFAELLTRQGDVEKKVIIASDKDLEGNGYKVIGVEIEDIMETIKSEAAKKREIGSAEAEVDKKKAEAIANPLKDNYPAAIAMAAETIGDKIVGKLLEAVKKEQPKGGK